MASTRAQQGALISNQLFLEQVAGSLLAFANTVFLEDAATANHAHRLLFSRALLQGVMTHAGIFASTYLTSAAISAAAADASTIADADVDATTAAQFDVYANYYAAQNPVGAFIGIGS